MENTTTPRGNESKIRKVENMPGNEKFSYVGTIREGLDMESIVMDFRAMAKKRLDCAKDELDGVENQEQQHKWTMETNRWERIHKAMRTCLKEIGEANDEASAYSEDCKASEELEVAI